METGKIVGDLRVTNVREIAGQVAGSVTVADGGELTLHGQITGSLTIEAGGRAVVAGQVVGDVFNEGGTGTIGGMVIGRLYDTSGGISIEPGSDIDGRRY